MGAIRPELKRRKGFADGGETADRAIGPTDTPVRMYAKGGPTGLYANIHAKRERIKAGSGERMRKPGAPGAPTAQAFKQSAKTAKR